MSAGAFGYAIEFTSRERKYLRQLQRRRDHLASRCAQSQDPRGPLSYDLVELNALRWILDLVEAPEVGGGKPVGDGVAR